MRFAGKRVLVTGASRGLGHVAAAAFAREGASLVLCGRDAQRLDDLRGGFPAEERSFRIAGDMTEPGMPEEVAKSIGCWLGGVDIVVHAMGGGFGFRDPLLSMEHMEILHRANLGAAAELNRLLIPGMMERGYGRVIHVGSTASGEACGSVGYNTCKAALAAYVRSLGNALAGLGIVVSGILPGAFDGPENAMTRFRASKPTIFQEWTERRLPRGRVGDAEEIIPLLFLLASDDASMMAGSCIPIDAGESVAYVA